MELPYDAAIPLLGIEKQQKLKRIENRTQTYTCPPVFIEESIHDSQR